MAQTPLITGSIVERECQPLQQAACLFSLTSPVSRHSVLLDNSLAFPPIAFFSPFPIRFHLVRSFSPDRVSRA